MDRADTPIRRAVGSRWSRRRWATLLSSAGVAVAVALTWLSPVAEGEPRFDTDPGVESIGPGWTWSVLREFPESVASIISNPGMEGQIFVGTAPNGGLYRFNTLVPNTIMTIQHGLGDLTQNGTCFVNRLGLTDLDGDGEAELIATTSQVMPRGRPRVYAFSLSPITGLMLDFVRTDIRSSWSHGFAPLVRPDGSTSLFLTFCGYGEIVEYRLNDVKSSWMGDTISAKQVGQLPASGEWIQTSDVDNDGRPELVVAAGYSRNRAVIWLAESQHVGASLEPKLTIDEQSKYGNVRVLAAELVEPGVRNLIAWWCTEIDGGDCDLIVYRLSPDGIEERRVIQSGRAEDLWANDGQATVADMDGDGLDELWFAVTSGTLWRYRPQQDEQAHSVARVQQGLGSITVESARPRSNPRLLMASGNRVLALESSTPVPVRALASLDDAEPAPAPRPAGFNQPAIPEAPEQGL